MTDRNSYNLSVEFCGVKLKNPFVNASGILSYTTQLANLVPYAGGMVTKSIGFEPRSGNEPPVVCCPGPFGMLNAMGLNNPGYKAFAEELDRAYTSGVIPEGYPVFISIFGSDTEQLATMVKHLEKSCVGFELNISCPNIGEDEDIGIKVGRDERLTYDCTKSVRDSTDKPLIVKESPAVYIYDRNIFKYLVGKAIDAGADAISAINTIPNAMMIDIYTGEPILTAKRGGLSGEAVRPIGVGCVENIHAAFPDIPILGMGGISKGEHAAEYLMAGANAIAIGTALADEPTEKMTEIDRNLRKIMENCGLTDVSDLTGWRRSYD